MKFTICQDLGCRIDGFPRPYYRDIKVISIGGGNSLQCVKLLSDACRRHFRERFIAIPAPAARLVFALAMSAGVCSEATRLGFPPIQDATPFVLAIAALDLYCRFVSQSSLARIAPVIGYSTLFLAAACIFGFFASYATQRLALPLRDELFLTADRLLGVDWLSFVHWIDDHAIWARIFRFAYSTIGLQIMLPVVVLSVFEHVDELRIYLLAFVISLTFTIVIAAVLPASGAVALVDSEAFHELRFTGGTPLEHLRGLRELGPLYFDRGGGGGLLNFPSFHAVVAVTTPLVLRSFRRLFYGLCVLDAAMLVATVTEGGHYAVDSIGGAIVAICSYRAARHIIVADSERKARTERRSVRLPAPGLRGAADNRPA